MSSARRNSLLPVSVDEAGVDVVAALGVPEGLQAHARALEGQDVHQAILKLVHGQVRSSET